MSMATEQMIHRIIGDRLREQPRERALYLNDAMAHASLALVRTTLVAVAHSLTRHGTNPREVEEVLRSAVADLIDDDKDARAAELAELAQSELIQPRH